MLRSRAPRRGRNCVAAPGARAVAVDARSRESLVSAMRGANVVLNCVGPFYRFGPPILEAAIEARVDYVDVCDDAEYAKG